MPWCLRQWPAVFALCPGAQLCLPAPARCALPHASPRKVGPPALQPWIPFKCLGRIFPLQGRPSGWRAAERWAAA